MSEPIAVEQDTTEIPKAKYAIGQRVRVARLSAFDYESALEDYVGIIFKIASFVWCLGKGYLYRGFVKSSFYECELEALPFKERYENRG